MIRHYIRVAPYALAKVINALDNDKEHACNIVLGLEDDEILISFETPRRIKCDTETAQSKAEADA